MDVLSSKAYFTSKVGCGAFGRCGLQLGVELRRPISVSSHPCDVSSRLASSRTRSGALPCPCTEVSLAAKGREHTPSKPSWARASSLS